MHENDCAEGTLEWGSVSYRLGLELKAAAPLPHSMVLHRMTDPEFFHTY
jgi:hypothetical protein